MASLLEVLLLGHSSAAGTQWDTDIEPRNTVSSVQKDYIILTLIMYDVLETHSFQCTEGLYNTYFDNICCLR